MTVRKQQLSKFTLLSIETLYFAGTFLGATGLLFVISGKNEEDIIIGIGAIITALVFQFVSHKSLISRHAESYYLLGAIFVGLAGLLISAVAPLAWLHRGIVFIFFIVLALYIYRGDVLLQRMWQGISLLCCVASFLFFFSAVTVSAPAYAVSPTAYFLVGMIIAIRYRWVRRSEAKPTMPTAVKEEGKFDISGLWRRGRIFEIFSLHKDATRLTIAEAYSGLLGKYNGHKEIERILKDAFEILNVHRSRELYCKSRDVMDDIRKKCGDRRFEKKEIDIWAGLWPEMEKRFHLLPEKVTDNVHRELVNKYWKKYCERK
jgi:hypothetical protein